MPSTFNLGASTNHMRPVKVEGGDRRHVFMKTSPAHARDAPYWAERCAAAADVTMQRIFYRWLMSKDLSHFNARTLPDTEVRQENQLAARPWAAAWLEEVIAEARWPPNKPLQETAETHAIATMALQTYQAFIQEKRQLGFRVDAEMATSQKDLCARLNYVLDGPEGLQVKISSVARLNAPVALGMPPECVPGRGDTVATMKFPSARAVKRHLQSRGWWGMV